MTNLVELSLNGSSVTVDNLKYLRRLPNLQKLHLQNARKINDEVLNELGRMKRLEWVDLVNTSVTGTAINTFENTHPRVQVVP